MIPLVLMLLPAIPHVILGIEHFVGKGNGITKKQAAMAALGDMLNIASTAAGTPGADSSAMAYIDDLIECTIKYFNANGTMSHSTGGTQ
jgi:hypothetical protein